MNLTLIDKIEIATKMIYKSLRLALDLKASLLTRTRLFFMA